jgi:copper chaperone CopZ
MKTYTITIKGMSCGHCIHSVNKEFGTMEGITINSIKIGSADVTIDESKVTNQALQRAVEEAGYSILAIQ